ncbi:hypothetical protein B296_00024553 [Ensete ventricosum]|uniref:Uncharacterized protein n=1 Tax=Ensete ventricosum TaxID=4639 RepID=A0A426YXL3_ENSVE|nr:hypothetical protein B296_00024553 [Ensete ventricosum]
MKINPEYGERLPTGKRVGASEVEEEDIGESITGQGESKRERACPQAENRKVEEDTMVEGACSRVEGVALILGDSVVVSATESGAVGGVVFLALCDLIDVLGLLFGAAEGVKRLQ